MGRKKGSKNKPKSDGEKPKDFRKKNSNKTGALPREDTLEHSEHVGHALDEAIDNVQDEELDFLDDAPTEEIEAQFDDPDDFDDDLDLA